MPWFWNHTGCAAPICGTDSRNAAPRPASPCSGEEFYQQARRAVYLADVLPRRGVRHLHAFRSDAVLCVWLTKQLTGMSVSAAIEESPARGRALLARLLVDFELVSISDKKLAALAGFPARDELELKKPPTHREFRFGPLRLKLRATTAQPDRSRAGAWLV